MIYLAISILFNAYTGIIFKYFDKYKTDHLVAIVLNYWVCVITGSLFIGEFPISKQIVDYEWSPYAIIIGLLFITVFNFIAISSVKVGITITQAANKLSLAIPVLFSFLLYKEEMNILKLCGITIALLAVYLTSAQEKKTDTKKRIGLFIFPLLIFIGSGLIDTIMKYVEYNFLSEASANLYLITLFFVAAIAGSIYLTILLFRGKKIHLRDIIGGILLGVPNYFSIYFFIKALQFDGLSSSAIIPINNIGILATVSLFGIIILKEKLNTKNYIGLGLTILAIILIYFGG